MITKTTSKAEIITIKWKRGDNKAFEEAHDLADKLWDEGWNTLQGTTHADNGKSWKVQLYKELK